MMTAVSPTVSVRDSGARAGNGTGSAKLPGPAFYSTVGCHMARPVPAAGVRMTCQGTKSVHTARKEPE